MTQRVPVFGQTVDTETRCVHWRGPTDVVAAAFNPGCALHAHLYFAVSPIGAPHA